MIKTGAFWLRKNKYTGVMKKFSGKIIPENISSIASGLIIK